MSDRKLNPASARVSNVSDTLFTLDIAHAPSWSVPSIHWVCGSTSARGLALVRQAYLHESTGERETVTDVWMLQGTTQSMSASRLPEEVHTKLDVVERTVDAQYRGEPMRPRIIAIGAKNPMKDTALRKALLDAGALPVQAAREERKHQRQNRTSAKENRRKQWPPLRLGDFCPFKKYKGQQITMETVIRTDRSYVTWLLANVRRDLLDPEAKALYDSLRR